jgi:8-oxo-dGTP pyrophosphatase MutT (NUDIX family)
MEKFSKMKPEESKKFKKDDVVYSDKYTKIIKYEETSILSGKDCVICIPYLIESNQFIIRQEYIPSFKYTEGQELHLSCVGGSVEMGESNEVALLRELQEEAGIVLRDNFVIDFDKPLFVNKHTTIKCYYCILPLTENDYHEIAITTDGSRIEKLSKTAKLDIKYLNSLDSSDIVTEFMLMKFRTYLNLG